MIQQQAGQIYRPREDDARWDLGPLDLLSADGPALTRNGDEGWAYTTLADGFDFGTADATKFIVESLMIDGADSRIDRYENRTIAFTVRIRARDTDLLHAGAAALRAQIGSRNTLRWTPPDGYGARTEFRVLNSVMRLIWTANDAKYARAGVKSLTYQITCECEPHGYSTDAVVRTFAATTTAPTFIDDASAVSAWANQGNSGGTAGTTAQETYLGESTIRFDWVTGTADAYRGFFSWTGNRPTTKLIGLDLAPQDGESRDVVDLYLNGKLPSSMETVLLESGLTVRRYWFPNPVADQGGQGALMFGVQYGLNLNPGRVRAATLLASDTPGVAAVYAIEADGAVRTTGTITCTRTVAMDSLIVHSDPQLGGGFNPRLPSTYPLGQDGLYEVWARVSVAPGQIGTATITDAAGRVVTDRTLFEESVTNGWVPIAALLLGGFSSKRLGSLTVEVIVNSVAVPAADIRLFRRARETSLFVSRKWGAHQIQLIGPSIEDPYGAIYIDDVAVYQPSVLPSIDDITITPPRTVLYVEPSNPANPVTIRATHTPAWPDLAGA